MNISIIIPVYNAEKFLEKAVISALQFQEVSEILLIEDCSPDNSLEICKNLSQNNNRIKVFQHPDQGNHGAGASRNLGLEKATGDYIAFLDADDYYLPNRFDVEKEFFSNEKIEGIFGAIGTEFLTEKGKEAFEKKFNSELTTVNYTAEGREIFDGLLGLTQKHFGTFFHLNTLTIRKSALKGLRFNEGLRVHQDSDFIIKLSFQNYLKTGIIDKAIAIRGVHDDNRITQIVNYSEKYKQRQLLLWQSLYEWSLKVTLNKTEREKINLQYLAYQLALKKGMSRYFSIFIATFRTPKILKTRYRFTYFGR